MKKIILLLILLNFYQISNSQISKIFYKGVDNIDTIYLYLDDTIILNKYGYGFIEKNNLIYTRNILSYLLRTDTILNTQILTFLVGNKYTSKNFKQTNLYFVFKDFNIKSDSIHGYYYNKLTKKTNNIDFVKFDNIDKKITSYEYSENVNHNEYDFYNYYLCDTNCENKDTLNYTFGLKIYEKTKKELYQNILFDTVKIKENGSIIFNLEDYNFDDYLDFTIIKECDSMKYCILDFYIYDTILKQFNLNKNFIGSNNIILNKEDKKIYDKEEDLVNKKFLLNSTYKINGNRMELIREKLIENNFENNIIKQSIFERKNNSMTQVEENISIQNKNKGEYSILKYKIIDGKKILIKSSQTIEKYNFID